MSESSTNANPVDSTSYTLPDGRTVIGKDAYEAEMVKAAFTPLADLNVARDAAVRNGDTPSGFTGEFVGSLSAILAQSLEGRAAWATALAAVSMVRPAVRTPKPGDLCRILDNFEIQHFGCDEHRDGVVTDVRTGKVVRRA